MSRVSVSQYLNRHYELQQLWVQGSPLYVKLNQRQQEDLHAYYLDNWQMPESDLIDHWKVVAKQDPSLPQRAGRAYARLKAPGLGEVQKVVDKGAIGLASVGEPEFDARKLAKGLLMMVENEQTEQTPTE